MRNYEKPFMQHKFYSLKEYLSSLNEWLSSEGAAYSEAGITTYIIMS